MPHHGEAAPTSGDEPLNKLMFGGSAVIHRQAERRPFMVVFFKAQLSKEATLLLQGPQTWDALSSKETPCEP